MFQSGDRRTPLIQKNVVANEYFLVSDVSDSEMVLPPASEAALNYSLPTLDHQRSTPDRASPALEPEPALSSTETLLRNIQGLLRVAADNARRQESQISREKGTTSHTVYLLGLAQYYLYLAATHTR